MKMYLVALAVGLLVGAIYGLLQVRSPAPPIVALVGLLGMLIGEQLVPLAREAIAGRSIAAHLHLGEAHPVFGKLPEGRTLAKGPTDALPPDKDPSET
jgi:XapX domain-containing protein